MDKHLSTIDTGLSPQEQQMLQKEELALGHALTETEKLPIYGMCFACGEHNPIGLHLHFFKIENGSMAFFTPKHEHQSYNDRMHGGLISTLLDEVMGNYLFMKEGKAAYTARLEIRFRQPILIGTPIKIIGKEGRRKGRLVIMEGTIYDADGQILTEATAHMMLE